MRRSPHREYNSRRRLSSLQASSWENFTPLLFSPEMWWDASDASTLTSSGSPATVSEWRDKSGNDYTITQATSTLQPTTGVTTCNGLNVLDFSFSAMNYFELSKTGFNPSTNGVTCCVLAYGNTTGNAEKSLIAQADLNGTGRTWIATTSTPSPRSRLGNVLTTEATALSGPQVITLHAPSGTSITRTLRRDKASYQSNTITIESTTGGIRVGAGKNASSGLQYQDSLGEIIVYPRALSFGEIDAVETYLRNKWGTNP